jgi:hypothetical protein
MRAWTCLSVKSIRCSNPITKAVVFPGMKWKESSRRKKIICNHTFLKGKGRRRRRSSANLLLEELGQLCQFQRFVKKKSLGKRL